MMDIYSIAGLSPADEIRERRHARAKVFRRPDGGLHHLCFGAPVHYWTDVGDGERPDVAEYDDIDVSLQGTGPDGDKTFGSYIALKNSITVGFRDDLEIEKYIGFRRGHENQMEWTLRQVQFDGLAQDVPSRFSRIQSADTSITHSTAGYEIITDVFATHARTALKTQGIGDFLIREQIHLKGFRVLNDKNGDEYIPINGEFQFEATDGHLLWIPAPKMWTDDVSTPVIGSVGVTHLLYESGGDLIYEKFPTADGRSWLASIAGPVYIDADTYYGSTADGHVWKTAATWSAAHDSAAGDYANNTSISLWVRSELIGEPPDWEYRIYRAFLFFDTSGLTLTPSSCSLYLYGTPPSGTSTICAQLSTASTTLTTDSYNDFSGSHYGTSSWSSLTWHALAFNATGRADINVSGYTKVCVREYSGDYSNSSTPAVNTEILSAESSHKPYLSIVEPAPAPPTNVSATDGVHIDKVVITWTKSTGATQYQVYRDGVGLGWLGDVATYNDTGADAPTITPGSTIASDGTSMEHVALSLNGTSTSNGTTHTYKVRAKGPTGESGDSATDTGYRGVGALGYQWQRSAGDSAADYSNIDGATSSTHNDTNAPADGGGRYYRCALTASGSDSDYSAADRGYISPWTPQIIVT